LRAEQDPVDEQVIDADIDIDTGGQVVSGVPNDQLVELLGRQELALKTTDHIAEVLGTAVTVNMLMQLAEEDNASEPRLKARRALRALEAVGREDSEIVRIVGAAGLYAVAESVISYGAKVDKLLELIKADGLTAEEATAAYELRRLIAEQTSGYTPSFPAIRSALAELGMTLKEAAQDPDAALTALDEGGFFINQAGRFRPSQTRFIATGVRRATRLSWDIDSVPGAEVEEYVRQATEGHRDETEE